MANKPMDKSLKRNYIARVYTEIMPHAKSKYITSMLYLCMLSNKNYDDTVKEITDKLKLSEEEYHREFKAFFDFRSVSMEEDKYVERLRNQVLLAPRACIVSFLELLGFDKDSEGFEHLAMAVLDGNKSRVDENIDDINSVCIKDGAECFGISEKEFADEVKKCLNTLDETSGFEAGEGAAYIRHKFVSPTEALAKRFKEKGLSPDNEAYGYLATMSKLMLLGDKIGLVYSVEAAFLHGVEYYDVAKACRDAIVNMDSKYDKGNDKKTVYNFLRSVCYQ